MKITIQDLANIVNKKMEDLLELNSDKRFKELSERRIRDYISKDLLHKGFKDGKFTYYDQSHIDKLLMLRQLQEEGIQERTLHKYSIDSNSKIEKQELNDKENILSVLDSIKNRSNNINKNSSMVYSPSLASASLVSNSCNLINLDGYKVKTKKEYIITENIALSVVEGFITQEEQDRALENLKNLFKNKL